MLHTLPTTANFPATIPPTQSVDGSCSPYNGQLPAIIPPTQSVVTSYSTYNRQLSGDNPTDAVGGWFIETPHNEESTVGLNLTCGQVVGRE